MVFIDKSLIIESLDSVRPIFETYKPSSTLYQFTKMDNGNFIIRYTSGQAILYIPFFIVGHIIALFTDFPADGFSKPYAMAAIFGGAVYSTLGFFFLAKLLKTQFRDSLVGLTLLILLFGTNLYSLAKASSLSSQMSQFFLISLLFVLANYYFKKPKIATALSVGGVFGLLCVSRPTEFITIVPLLLWPVFIPGLSVRKEIQKFFKRKAHVWGFVIIVSGFAFIQFGYWIATEIQRKGWIS